MTTSYTTEVLGGSVHDLLQAYNVHHTGTEDEEEQAQLHVRRPQVQPNPASTSSQNRSVEPPSQQSDPDDVSSRRRVPPYRETSRNHDLSSRPAGLNGVETAIVQTMFFGVYITGAVNRIWRQTGGRINDKIFHYEVGGEW